VIELTPKFFASLTEFAVPLDARALAALKHSALALDVYTWLAPPIEGQARDRRAGDLEESLGPVWAGICGSEELQAEDGCHPPIGSR
jgi:hypothetical protein